MYSGWVTDMHTHMRGACPHACGYCYVQHGPAARMGHYSGPLRLEEKEFAVKYGKGKKIFIEHCADLFAQDIPEEWIHRIFIHCLEWPENEYIFQTKNPLGAADFALPSNDLHQAVFGITLESDIWYREMGKAPRPLDRIEAWPYAGHGASKRFITIEPIMRFSPVFPVRLKDMKPDFVNIGADSKRCGLPEPEPDDIWALIAYLHEVGIEYKLKPNLSRLLPELNTTEKGD
ncbi:MAG: DUF5131 family protein [Methanobacteriota archaeon]